MKKLYLQGKEGIREAIRKRGMEISKQLSDREIFMSPDFSRYAMKLADFILRKHRLYYLDIKWNTGSGAPIAYTDGKMIFWNVGNEIAAQPKLLERRFKTNMGILFHEAAHSATRS